MMDRVYTSRKKKADQFKGTRGGGGAVTGGLCALLVGVGAALFLSSPQMTVYAAAQPDLTQQSLEDLMNIQVTSVSKKEQKVSQAPAAVFVISAEDIRRSNALNLPDLLRMVPGLDVAQIEDGKWAISARGFNGQYSNKLLVLVDGRTVYTPLFAGVFWDSQNVPLESIDRIEIIRGPGAAIWGSNAVNGVINIATKRAADTKGGLLVATGGNTGSGPNWLRYGTTVGGKTDARFEVDGQNNEASPSPIFPGAYKGLRLYHADFRADSTLSAKDSLTTEGEIYSGSGGELVAGIVSITPPQNGIQLLNDRYSGWNLLSRWDHKESGNSATSFRLYFDRFTRGDTSYGAALDTVDAEFQQRVGWGSRHDMVWGGGYRFSSDMATQTVRVIMSPEKRQTQLFSSFFQDEITLRPDRVFLSLGARLEHNDFRGFNFQPSAGLVWTPDAKNMLWLAAASADRTPSRADTGLRINYAVLPGPGGLPVFISLLGNPHQKNEHLDAYQAGLRSAWSSRFSLDSTVFYHRYRDLMSQEPGAPQVEMSPAPHLLVPTYFDNKLYGEAHGAEVFAKLRLARVWTLSPGYAFMALHLHTFKGSGDTMSIAGTQGGSPDHQAQLRSIVNLPWHMEWNSSAYFVNRLPEQAVPSYTRVDSGLSWQAGERFSVMVAGQNILRDRHMEYTGPDSTVEGAAVRRALFAKLTWSF